MPDVQDIEAIAACAIKNSKRISDDRDGPDLRALRDARRGVR